MPRDGALTLSDVRSPTLAIVCEPGGRRGRYRLDRLMAEQGDAMLPRTLSRERSGCGLPRPESILSEDGERPTRCEMALDVERVLDDGVNRQEAVG
jgi:hypothetical protein